MPVKTFKCSCGITYDDLVGGATVAEEEAKPCPSCSSLSRTEQITGGHRMSSGYDYENADPLEKQMAISNKRKLEAQSEKILSGEITIREPKGQPTWARPECPSHLRKTYY